MNVTSRVPSTALAKISRKTYRPRSRSTGGSLPRQVRRGNHRQLRQFFFSRVQFQVVNQDRGRHYAGFDGETGAADQGKRRGVVHVLEGCAIVAGRQNVFQGTHAKAAEAHAAHEFFVTVHEDFINQDRHADGTAALLRCDQAARFIQTGGGGEVHLADDDAVRL